VKIHVYVTRNAYTVVVMVSKEFPNIDKSLGSEQCKFV